MVWVAFLQNYESHFTDAVIDVGRFHHAEALVASNIARWATDAEVQAASGVDDDTGDDVAIYDEGVEIIDAVKIIDFVGTGVTATDAGAKRTTVTITGAEHTGETGSIFFAGAGGGQQQPTEDNANLFYDDSNNRVGIGTNVPLTDLHVQNPTAGGTLTLATGDTTVTGASNELGRINFQAPLEASGGDAVLVSASIHAVADNVFSSTLNRTDLVFSVSESETAVEWMRLTGEKGHLGHGTTTPNAPVHIKHPVGGLGSSIFKVEREDTSAGSLYSVYIGDGGSDGDFIVTADGRCGVNIDAATCNAMLRVETNADAALAFAMFVGQFRTTTNSKVCARFHTDGDCANCVEVHGDSITTVDALQVQAHALTTGSVASFTSDSADTSTRQIVLASNTDPAATESTCLKLYQNATNAASKFIRMVSTAANAPVFTFFRTGHIDWLPIADATETDTAPSDDHTIKKISIQKLASAPTNAAYIPFQNNPGSETFYLVLQEG